MALIAVRPCIFSSSHSFLLHHIDVRKGNLNAVFIQHVINAEIDVGNQSFRCDIRLIRACSESPRVRMAPSDFSPDDAKTAGNTLCINEDFGKIWRKRCQPDVRGEILNRLLGSAAMSVLPVPSEKPVIHRFEDLNNPCRLQ